MQGTCWPHTAHQTQPILQRETTPCTTQPCPAHGIYVLWERATAQGHTTDTRLLQSTHTQGNTSLGTGPLDAAAATAAAIPLHGSGPPASHTRPRPACTAVHTAWVCSQATLAHAASLTLQRAGCAAGKAAPLGSRQRMLSPASLHSHSGGCSGVRWGRRPPGRLSRESRVPRLPGRFPTAPRPSRFGRKRLIFLITLVLVHPRPRSCEQLHSRLALHT